MAFNLTYEIDDNHFELGEDTLKTYQTVNRSRMFGKADTASACELALIYLGAYFLDATVPAWFPVAWLLLSGIGNFSLCNSRVRVMREQLKRDYAKELLKRSKRK